MAIPIQTKLENSLKTIKRKLYDNHLRLKGQEVKAIKLYEVKNKYKDVESVEIIGSETITVYIDLQNLEIPLNRYRLDAHNDVVDSESVYLFEIIPIDMYAKWDDEIEPGDLLILLLKDDDLEIPIAFKVSDNIGRFQKNLLMRKYLIAPYNPSNIDSEVLYAINEYIANN